MLVTLSLAYIATGSTIWALQFRAKPHVWQPQRRLGFYLSVGAIIAWPLELHDFVSWANRKPRG